MNVFSANERGKENLLSANERRKEKFLIVLVAAAIAGLLGVTFYQSVFAVFCLWPGTLYLSMRVYQTEKNNRRKRRTEEQFLKAVLLLADYLRSGTSTENALSRTAAELELLYGAKSLAKQFHEMDLFIRNGNSTEEAFRRFAEEEKNRVISDFVEVFTLVKRRGGQLAEVIELTAANLTEEFRAKEKIETELAAKKTEAYIMDAMPAVLLLFLELTSPELLRPLYGNAVGIGIMTVLLLGYVFAVLWSQKIVSMETEDNPTRRKSEKKRKFGTVRR